MTGIARSADGGVRRGGARADPRRRPGRLRRHARWRPGVCLGGNRRIAEPNPTGTGTSNCPSSNPPNQMTLVAGTPQTTTLQSAFATGLQVALTQQRRLPRHERRGGVPVTFSAPAGGASGVFSTSGSNTAIVGADASGSGRRADVHRQRHRGQLHRHRQLAVWLGLVLADQHRRGHTGEDRRDPAEEQIGERRQPLPAAAAGQGPRRRRQPGRGHDGHVHARLRQRRPCGTSSAASASFAGGGTQATATTDASGLATSPALHREHGRRLVHRHRLGLGAAAGAGGKAPAKPGRPPSRRSASRSQTSPASPPSSPPASAPPSPPRREPRSRSGSPSPSPTPTRTPCPGALVTFSAPRRRERALHAPLPRLPPPPRPRLPRPHGQGQDQRLRDRRGAPLHRQPPAGRLHRQGQRQARQAGGVRARQRSPVRRGERRRRPHPRACRRRGPRTPEAAGLRSRARRERGVAHAAYAGGALGAGDRDRGRRDRGGARPVLLQPGGAAGRDRQARHESADRHQRPELRRQDRGAAAGGAGDDRAYRPGRNRRGDGEGRREGVPLAADPRPSKPTRWTSRRRASACCTRSASRSCRAAT